MQTSLNNLLSIPTSPGSGNGTALVSLTSSGSFLITLGGSLANVSVPLLLASNFTGAPVPAVTIADQAWLVASPAAQTIATSGAGGTFVLNFTGNASTASVTVGATSAATQTSLQAALNSLLGSPVAPGSGNGTATVDVTSSGNFLITFGGSLAGATVPLLVAGARSPAPPAPR